MSTSWDGLALQTEFSTLLGDTSTAFKAKVLEWMNEIQLDITSRHDWPFTRRKGKKILTADEENHSLYPAAPGAPTVVASTGGSLTADSAYKVLVTYYEGVSGYETVAGTASSSVTPTGTDLTISVSAIPVSDESLVTARKVYISVASGNYLYYSTISDNTTTTLSITADSSSTIEPPDYTLIKKMYGYPFLETSSQLVYRDLDQLRLLFQGSWSSGTPNFWTWFSHDAITVYPVPSSDTTISFYYYIMPQRLYAEATNQPFVPPWLKPVLRAGVIARGYEFRDRDGQQGKLNNYEEMLKLLISRDSAPMTAPQRVRDVEGNSDGWEI